jgi:hypothetical protein
MKILQVIGKEKSYESDFTLATRCSLIRYHSSEAFWSDLTRFYSSDEKAR